MSLTKDLASELASRIHPGAKIEREMITSALGAADAVREKAAAIRLDERLSKAGISAKIIEYALGEPWSNLQQQRGKAAEMAAAIALRRAEMVPPRPDPANLADAILKSDLRAMLRNSTRADRLRLARDDDAFAVAALTAPAILSGFGSDPIVPGQLDDLELVRTIYQQRHFVELFAGLEVRDEALAAVNAAIESACRQILNEAGVAETEVGRLTAKNDDPEDPADVDPANMPVITRLELDAWSVTDPGRASAEMKRVYQGFAKLVDG